ncbi:hypothetical protein QUA56_16775 [Microcoleus sp. N3A4]|uniref:hypothetical protein n=1 Tax=Microcoleus sp. N3A4 TaxID=3055379 RepID=UPI002FD047CB
MTSSNTRITSPNPEILRYTKLNTALPSPITSTVVAPARAPADRAVLAIGELSVTA